MNEQEQIKILRDALAGALVEDVLQYHSAEWVAKACQALAATATPPAQVSEHAELRRLAHNYETDIARRLRQHATGLNLSQDLHDALTAGASESDCFYRGMMDWKATAEAKDAELASLRASAVADLNRQASDRPPANGAATRKDGAA